MPQVISTMTDSVEYAEHRTHESGGVPELIHSVTIKGGANLAQRKLLILGEGPSSKAGVATHVTDEQLEFLQQHKLFQFHKENGYIEIIKSDSDKIDAEDVAKSLKKADGAAPLTEKDLDEKDPSARLKGAKVKSAKE